MHLVPSCCGFSRPLLQEFSPFNPASSISPSYDPVERKKRIYKWTFIQTFPWTYKYFFSYILKNSKQNAIKLSWHRISFSLLTRVFSTSCLYFLSLHSPLYLLQLVLICFISYQYCLVKVKDDIYIVKFNQPLLKYFPNLASGHQRILDSYLLGNLF